VRFTFDTNILLYAIVEQNEGKRRVALDLVRRARERDCVVTLQTLGEMFRALTGKLRRPVAEAIVAVSEWRAVVPVVTADGPV
jgi:predicted nucleic acid-binding protein